MMRKYRILYNGKNYKVQRRIVFGIWLDEVDDVSNEKPFFSSEGDAKDFIKRNQKKEWKVVTEMGEMK